MLITFDKINIRKEEVLVTNVQNINFPETNTQKFAQSCLRLTKTPMRKLRTYGYQSQETNQMMRTATERRTLSTAQMKRMEKMLLMDLHNLTLRIVLNM